MNKRVVANAFLKILIALTIWRETGSVSVPIAFLITWLSIAYVWHSVKINDKIIAEFGRHLWTVKPDGAPRKKPTPAPRLRK